MPMAPKRNRSEVNDRNSPPDLSVTVDELLNDPAFSDLDNIYDMYGSFDNAIPAPLTPQKSLRRNPVANRRPRILVIDAEAAHAASPDLGVQIISYPAPANPLDSLSPEPLISAKRGAGTASTTPSLHVDASPIDLPPASCYGDPLPGYLLSQWSPRPRGAPSTLPGRGSRLSESDYGSPPSILIPRQKQNSGEETGDHYTNLSSSDFLESSSKAFRVLPPRPPCELLGGDRSLGSFFNHESGFTPSQSSGTPDNALTQSKLWQQLQPDEAPALIHPVVKLRENDQDEVWSAHDRRGRQNKHLNLAPQTDKDIYNIHGTDFPIMHGPFVLAPSSKPTSSIFDSESRLEPCIFGERVEEVSPTLHSTPSEQFTAFIQAASSVSRPRMKSPPSDLFPGLTETHEERMDRLDLERRLRAGRQNEIGFFGLDDRGEVRQVHHEIAWDRLCGIEHDATKWPERREALKPAYMPIKQMQVDRLKQIPMIDKGLEKPEGSKDFVSDGGLKRTKSLKRWIFRQRKDKG